MIFNSQLQHQLQQLVAMLKNISYEQFVYKSKFLSNASIGAHTRHIIELLQCTIIGYEIELIDYINRDRNFEIEVNLELAVQLINQLQTKSNLQDKILYVICEDGTSVCSSYYRELLYNVEHIIHHLALIKVSLVELNAHVVDNNFGFAYSTLQYKKTQQLA
jgi:hypothetical protein